MVVSNVKGFRWAISGRPTKCVLFGFKQSQAKAADCLFDADQVLVGSPCFARSNSDLEKPRSLK
jgi:hypothetical protein